MYLTVCMNGAESMNLILPALEKTFGWAPPDVAVRLGAIRIIAIPSMFIVGSIMLKFGVKRVLLTCTVVTGLFIIAMANVKTLDQFVYVNVGIVVLGPAAMIGFAALSANWWVRSRGRALGIITIAFPLSTATFTFIGTKGIAAWGYQAFYTGFGLVNVLVCLLGIWLVHEKPESIGLSPDGIPFTEQEKIEIAQKAKFQSKWNFKRIIKTKEIWAFAFSFALLGMLVGTIMSQLIPVFTSSGIPINKALGMMSAAALVGMPISYIWGWLDDKIGTPITTAIFSLTLIAGCLGMAYGSADRVSLYYMAIVSVALGTAGLPNLQQSLLAYLVGRAEFVNISRYTNILQALFTGVSMAYVPVTYAYFGNYRSVFLSLIIFGVIAIALLIFCRQTFDPERQKFMEEGKVL
jgi:MFS family permease